MLTMTRITFEHLVGWLEASAGDFTNRELLMISFLCRDDGSVGDQREVNPGVGNQVGLELSKINIESSIESKRGSDGRDDLSNEPVEVGVGGSLDVQVTATDVIDGLVNDHEGTVRVLQGGVGLWVDRMAL